MILAVFGLPLSRSCETLHLVWYRGLGCELKVKHDLGLKVEFLSCECLVLRFTPWILRSFFKVVASSSVDLEDAALGKETLESYLVENAKGGTSALGT